MKFEPLIVQIKVIIHCKFYANWLTSSYVFALSKFVRFFFFATVKKNLRSVSLGCKDKNQNI